MSVDGFEGSTHDANETDDFVEDTLDDGPHDRLPPNARCLFHPSVNDNTRKHVGNIFKCFGARPGVHYVTAQRLVDVGEKITQASGLGSAIVLASVDGAAHALEFVRAQTPDTRLVC